MKLEGRSVSSVTRSTRLPSIQTRRLIIIDRRSDEDRRIERIIHNKSLHCVMRCDRKIAETHRYACGAWPVLTPPLTGP